MVPNGWEHKSFKQILKLDRGSSPRPIVNFVTDSDDGVNWIKIGDTKGEAAFVNSTKEKITKEGAKKSRKVIKGEIILSNSMSYGKPYILNIDGFIHDGWFVIRHYEQNLDRDYLIQLLGGELVQRQYRRLAAGGVVSNINSELVYSVKVDIPPLQEQRKIAKILGTWDKAISTTKCLIHNSKQQKKALMQQLLTGKKHLLDESGKPFEDEWEEVQLGEVCSKVTDGAHHSPKSVDSGYPMYSVKDMKPTGFEKNTARLISETDFLSLVKQNCKPEINDILIAKDGSILKYCFVVKEEIQGVILSSIALLRPKLSTIQPEFIAQYFSQEYIKYFVGKALTSGSGVPRIILKDFKGIHLKIPTIVEQQKISVVLTNADNEIELLEQQLTDLKQEKKALMQQLLTGKRRVKINNTEAA